MEAIRANNNQLSALSRLSSPVEVDLAIARLLKEIFTLTLSPATPPQLAAMASQIRTNFWMLRFEEITYALNQGINGKYGTSNKNLAYETLAEWLNAYDAERTEAVTKDQVEKNSVHKSMKQVEDLVIDGKSFLRVIPPVPEEKKREAEAEKLNRPAPTKEWFDKKNYEMICSLKDQKDREGNPIISDMELLKFHSDAEMNDWPETLKLVAEEIKKRTDEKTPQAQQAPPQAKG